MITLSNEHNLNYYLLIVDQYLRQKKMLTKIFYLLYIIRLIINAQGIETNVAISPSMCFNDTDCHVTENTNDLDTTTPSQTISEGISESKKSAGNVTTVSLLNKTPPNTTMATLKSSVSMHRNHEGLCGCDLTVFSCDINCCCDMECKDIDVEDLFSCEDHHSKVYDTRHCYGSDYSQPNNSHLLDKLRDNLLCIVVDNLPPVYSIDYDPIISNRSIFDQIVSNNKKSRFKWDQNTTQVTRLFDLNKPYRYGDIIWKMQNNYIKRLEIPQTGFTGICSFKKAVKYLEDLRHSCMQIILDDSNLQLFTEAFTNFTIIASPNSYRDLNSTSNDQSCQSTTCIPVKSYYCSDSWGFCKNESGPSGSCQNGKCKNIVKGVRFVITHSGIKGINSIEVYLRIGTASKEFYQDFRVEYKWLRDDESKVFRLSGNPGYIMGKPILIGNLITNKTEAADYSYVNVCKEKYFLSLPISDINGQCSENHRYTVNFGEDLKLTCKMESQTRNFTMNSCVDLQRQITDALLKDVLFNVTDVDQYPTYVAKWNYLDNNGTNDWVKILFDRIPQNVVTGQVIGDRLMCSGLVASMRIDIVYRHLPEPQIIDNYKILGVAITFSEDSDIYWEKCETENCMDILSVDVISYVMFHDVSRPSKYSFAEGPNLDISLPQDFFYPFSNSGPVILIGAHLKILCTCVSLIFTKPSF